MNTPNPNPSPELREAIARQIDPVAFDEDGLAIYRQARRDAAFRAADRVAALSPQTLPAPGEVGLREVLKPFAKWADWHDGMLVTDETVAHGRGELGGAPPSYIRVGDLRRARTALNSLATVAAANAEGVAEAAFRAGHRAARIRYAPAEPNGPTRFENVDWEDAAIRLLSQGGGK